MVRLDDLDVKAGKLAGGKRRGVAQRGDTQRVVARVQHGARLGKGAQLRHLLVGVARGARDERGTRAAHVAGHGRQRHDVREVDEDVGGRGGVGGGEVKADLGHNLERGRALLGARGLGRGADERAHATLAHDGDANGGGVLTSQ